MTEKRLVIRLPADHPVFSLPPGARSRVVREWIDRGRDVVRALEEIREEIERLHCSIGRDNGPERRIAEDTGQGKVVVDPKAFLDL
ncbi:MAG: hypothetical protein ACUVRC_10755 [Desulfotomaculales bacterium]